ncbi:acetyltransferase [Marinobacter sp. SS8-8]|uniref:acetyltransferase n=1 Tax=Marinobacter sp. SS8-8 TaxID=3050452 RepID=UPI0026E00838|nr:acetyltransferase [Marinobacter sp. SS8-8]
MKRLAILGASGHGKVVADAAELSGWDDVIFYDDAWLGIETNGAWPVNGGSRELIESLGSYDGIVVAIGDNTVRLEKLIELEAGNAPLVVIIHPSAQVSRYAKVSPGTVILANSVVNAGAELGKGCIINTGSVVEHDCTLAGGVHVSPNAALAGGVVVGRASWIGIGAAVKQLVSIGDGVIVGMGAVVTRNMPDGVVAFGSPARPM